MTRVGLIAAGALGLGLLAAVSGGSLGAVIAAALIVPVVASSWRLPVDVVAAGVLFCAFVVDDPRSRPYMGIWKSPLAPLGRFLFDALDKTVSVPGLKVFGIEVCMAGLAALVLLRAAVERGVPTCPKPLLVAAVVSAVSVVLLEVIGMARGGDVRFSMLQLRPMLMMGVAIILFAFAFRSARAPWLVVGALLAAALVRAGLGIYFWATQLSGGEHEDMLAYGGGGYISSHADTVLWVSGVLVCLASLLERPGRRALVFCALCAPPLLLAIGLNNRRVASVSLLVGVVVLYFGSAMKVRRRMHRLALYGAPILVPYLAVASAGGGTFAAPVNVLQSVSSGGDASANMRGIENYNLLRTARRHPIIGSGLGVPYEEEVVAISIADVLEAYLYLPHNSLLWLAGAGGLLGTIAFWLVLPVGVFFAVCLYDGSKRPIDRVAALVAMTTVSTYATQCFADIGMHGWLPVFVTSGLLGLAGGRCAAAGTWRNA